MTTTSFRRRAAAVATGTLAAGALSFVPAMAGLSAASADTGKIDYTCAATFPSSFASYNGNYSATVSYDLAGVDAVGVGDTVTPSVSAVLTFGDDLGAKLKPSPVNKFTGSTGVLDTAGPGAAGTSNLTFTEWVRGGGMGSDMPPMEITGTGSWGSVTATEPGALEFRAGDLAASLKMGTTFGPTLYDWSIDCTPTAGGTVLVETVDVGDEPAPEVPAGVANAYDCEYGTFGAFGATFYTVLDTSVKATQGKKADVPVTSTLVWDDEWTAMAARIAMTFRNGAAQTATSAGPIGLTFSDTAVPAAGEPMVWNASGSLALDTSAAGVKTVVPADIALTVEASNRFTGGEYSAAELDCTLVGDAATLGDITVDKAPVVAAPAATKTAVKTAYAKKAKKLTATVTVTSAKAKPAGKATLVLKKGKKQVGKATVNIKNGSAKAVFKKIAKGNYKLTVKYAGNKNFKASSKTITVKVK